MRSGLSAIVQGLLQSFIVATAQWRSFCRNQRCLAELNPAPPTGVVTTVLPKPAIGSKFLAIAAFTDGSDSDASWLALLAHTSEIQVASLLLTSLATM